MAFQFKKWLLEKLRDGQERTTTEEMTGEDFFGLSAEYYIRELAFWSCVNMIANAVSKCEFKTYVKGQETKGDEYYLWNIAPNLNQNSSAFMHKWIAKLYQNNEALVVEVNGQLLVADGYSRKEYALYDDIFTQVQVGDFTFERSFTQSEVLFLRLSDKNMRPVVNGMYGVYKKLIDYGMASYCKSRGTKGVIAIDAMMTGNPEMNECYTALKNGQFTKFADAESAVLPLYRGMQFTELGNKTYTSEGTRDIRAMIDDVLDFTAKAFGIPPTLLNGEVEGTAEALEHFLTFCIDPLVDMLQEEINRKRSGKAGYLAGTYVRIDTKCIKHVDLLSVSTAIDKLIASGAFCINDIRELVGEQPIGEEWAQKHFMTKNYSTVQDLLDLLQAEQKPDTG